MSPPSVRIGPFEIVSRLGHGGMGDVYRGIHVDQRRDVAIKVLTTKKAWQPSYLSAFRREVRAVASLDHRNIVTVYDYGEVPVEAERGSAGALLAGSPYLVLELADEGTISDKRGRLPWPLLRSILLDLLDALGHAHARGVVHRDLKPGNVLLSRDGVKLTDFGLAHIMGPKTESGQPRGGTPAYMAPEQFDGNTRLFGPWTDLYAFGCLAWALVAGRPPFPGRDWMKVMHAQVTKNPPPLRPRIAVPRGFENWLRQCLRKDPVHRFRWAADAHYALRKLPIEVEPLPHPPSLLGEETLDEVPTMVAPGDGATTTMWPTLLPGAPPPEIPSIPLILEPPTRRAPPPLAATHQTKSPRTEGVTLTGAGLGLYGLRQVPLVGRDRERDMLWQALREVFDTGEPRTLVLSGPEGCGKSRLARWLVERAHEAGAATVLHAVNSPTQGPVDGLGAMVSRYYRAGGLERGPLEVFLQKRLAPHGVDDPWEVSALSELIRPSRDSTVRFARPTERYALMLRLLRRIGEERPVILWADDVQWSHDTLMFANYVLKETPSAPVLLVLGVRDTALPNRPAEQARLQMLLHLPRCLELPVPPLTDEHANELLKGLLMLQEDLADQVIARVGGNPLFAIQIVGDWVQRGVLESSAHGFVLVEGADTRLPSDLLEVWNDQVDRAVKTLPPRSVLSLEVAAGLGIDVAAAEWRDVCVLLGCPAPEVITGALEEARLLRAFGDGWMFEHAMLRESLVRRSREAGHWTAVNMSIVHMLRGRYPEQAEGVVIRLGRHLLDAGVPEQAITPLLEGARSAAARSEYRLARELLDCRDEAISRLDTPADERVRVESWLLRARLFAEQGRPLDAEGWAKRAERAVRQHGYDDLLGPSLHRCALALAGQGDLDDAERYFLAGRSWYKAEGDAIGMGDCLVGLGRIHEQRGRHDRAREVLEQARTAYAGAGDLLNQASCLESIARSARHSGDLAASRRLLTEAFQMFESLGARSGMADSLLQLALVEHGCGDYMAAREYCGRAMDLFTAIGDPAGQLQCHNGFGEFARFAGDYEEAESGYRRALQIAIRYGIGESVYPRVNLGLVLLQQHRFLEARTTLETEITDLVERGMLGLAGGVHMSVMTATAALGDLAAFQRHFRAGRTLLETTGTADRDAAWPAEMCARILAQQGEMHWSRACWELALSQYERMGLEEESNRIREMLASLPFI